MLYDGISFFCIFVNLELRILIANDCYFYNYENSKIAAIHNFNIYHSCRYNKYLCSFLFF